MTRAEEILNDWQEELAIIVDYEELLYITLINSDQEILYMNEAISHLLKEKGTRSIINPNFTSLQKIKSDSSLIFKGYITFGDIQSVNTSLYAHVFRKNNNYLIIGGAKVLELLEQNRQMAQLNREVNNLQRELILKNHTLEETLNELNRTNEKLEKLIADKDLFLSILAHDVKSPFNSILGFSSMLAEDTQKLKTNSIIRYAGIINDISTQTYHLLEDILNWRNAESGNMPFNPMKFEISQLIQPIYNQMNFRAKEKKIKLEFPNLNGTVITADINILSAVLRNLISNSIKFTKAGGKVSLVYNESIDYYEFRVIDKGVGLSTEEIENLLKSKNIKSKSGTKNEKGTGLGLYMCKEFIKCHKGKFEISSKLGEGSTFTFKVPKI